MSFVGSPACSSDTLSSILKESQSGQYNAFLQYEQFFLVSCLLPGCDSLCGFPSFFEFKAAFLQKLVIDETLQSDFLRRDSQEKLLFSVYFKVGMQCWEVKKELHGRKTHLSRLSERSLCFFE